MSISNIVKEFSFFQIYVTADLEHEGKIYPNVKQFNNDSILTIDNWEQNKDMFFCQRMERYNPSLTVKEKILLELETLEKIPISQTGFKILKERYKEYLTDKQEQPQEPKAYLGQPTNDKANKFFDFLIDNYRPNDKAKVKFVNILYYLKNDADKNHFIFRVKQEDFKILIKEKTGVEIKKFEKSEQYLEVDKPIFHKLENTFLKTL